MSELTQIYFDPFLLNALYTAIASSGSQAGGLTYLSPQGAKLTLIVAVDDASWAAEQLAGRAGVPVQTQLKGLQVAKAFPGTADHDHELALGHAARVFMKRVTDAVRSKNTERGIEVVVLELEDGGVAIIADGVAGVQLKTHAQAMGTPRKLPRFAEA